MREGSPERGFVARLGFPDDQDVPTEGSVAFKMLFVARADCGDLFAPIIGIGFRRARAALSHGHAKSSHARRSPFSARHTRCRARRAGRAGTAGTPALSSRRGCDKELRLGVAPFDSAHDDDRSMRASLLGIFIAWDRRRQLAICARENYFDKCGAVATALRNSCCIAVVMSPSVATSK